MNKFIKGKIYAFSLALYRQTETNNNQGRNWSIDCNGKLVTVTGKYRGYLTESPRILVVPEWCTEVGDLGIIPGGGK